MMASALKPGDRLYSNVKGRTLYGEVVSSPVYDSIFALGPPIYFWEAELAVHGGRATQKKIIAGKSGLVKFIVERDGEVVYTPSFKKDIQEK